MKAVRLHAIGDLRCDEVPVPAPRGQELLLRVGACGVCGSDFPRIYAHGTSSGIYPLTLGHEFSGEVVAVGEEADKSLLGARGAVFPLIPCRRCDACVTGNYAMCEDYDYLGSRRDGAFAEYCLIPSAWHLLRSDSADLESLALTEPACVAQHALRQARVQAGGFGVIFGAGPIGIMAARWARIFGAEVLLADISEDKVAFAQSRGFAAVNSARENVPERIRALNRGRLADYAIEGTGAESALIGCVESVRACGSLAMLGNHSDKATLPADIQNMILRKEMAIYGVWNSSRAPYPVNEWSYTVRMMDEGKLEVADLITDRFSLEALPGGIGEIRSGARSVVKAMYSC